MRARLRIAWRAVVADSTTLLAVLATAMSLLGAIGLVGARLRIALLLSGGISLMGSSLRIARSRNGCATARSAGRSDCGSSPAVRSRYFVVTRGRSEIDSLDIGGMRRGWGYGRPRRDGCTHGPGHRRDPRVVVRHGPEPGHQPLPAQVDPRLDLRPRRHKIARAGGGLRQKSVALAYPILLVLGLITFLDDRVHVPRHRRIAFPQNRSVAHKSEQFGVQRLEIGTRLDAADDLIPGRAQFVRALVVDFSVRRPRTHTLDQRRNRGLLRPG